MGDCGPPGHSVGFVKLRGGVKVACGASPAAMQKAAMNMEAMRSSSHANSSGENQHAPQSSGDTVRSSLPKRQGQGFKRPRQQPPAQNVTVNTISRENGTSAGPAALSRLEEKLHPGTSHDMVQNVECLAAQRELANPRMKYSLSTPISLSHFTHDQATSLSLIGEP